jgi:anti-sigma B factor antagonist
MIEQRVRLRGEIDLTDAPALRQQLSDLVSTTTGDVVIECDDLTLIDSVGIAVLLSTRRILRIQGREMRVENLRGMARHATDALGLTQLLTLDDLEPARRAPIEESPHEP